MTQQWREVTLEVPRADAESWADAFLAAGALSVQAEDADADSPDEQPLFGEPAAPGRVPPDDAGVTFGWTRTRLAVLLDFGSTPQAVLSEAAAALGREPPAMAALRLVEDRDWVRATQAQFEPIPVGERLLVVPSWHMEAALRRHDGRLRLMIDPGLAFGTGSHPTTRLCLEWLEQAEVAGKRVIDYGCGSGILAIAAARLGAAQATGIDIDPQALASAADNAGANGVEIIVQSAVAAMPAAADIVVANILSNPLKLLAPMLASLVAPGGALVLSGVLERQVDEVAQFYDSSVPVAPWRTSEGWVCLAGRRP